MYKIWTDSGGLQLTEQRLANPACHIRKKGWFSEVKLDEIKRISTTPVLEHCQQDSGTNKSTQTVSDRSSSELPKQPNEIRDKQKVYMVTADVRTRLPKLTDCTNE